MKFIAHRVADGHMLEESLPFDEFVIQQKNWRSIFLFEGQ
jgi:hypothetical protein